MARMLLFAIGAKDTARPVTRAQGETTLLNHLKSRGLDVTGIVIDNGSGLSRTSRVTSRFMTALLRQAWRAPSMPEFMASLSIAGIDGTTRRRFRGGAERGRMHLKTGSLQNVSAVTGYVHAQNGKTYAVNVMVNYANANYGIGTELQNAVLAWTFKQP
jgi:D-alanyl-D-alanine carboxypeptidase/D-alanyl-D-alanine-endopeptidase (penicillin-binding protein 4)